MDSELINAFLLGASAVGCGMGVVWQIKRRTKPKPKVIRSGAIDRVPSRPQVQAKKEEIKESIKVEQYGVVRPVMLAYTTIANDLQAAELFVQRANKIDENYYQEIPTTKIDRKSIAKIFEHLPILDNHEGSDLSSNIYTLNFSPVIVNALNSGFRPRVNATAMDLQVLAITKKGEVLGEPMSTPDYSWGADSAIQTLWDMLHTGEDHPLEGELRRELSFLESKVAKVKLIIPAVRGHAWKEDWERLFDLSRDLRRLGLEEGKAQDRLLRADRLAQTMRDHNKRIDEALLTLTLGIKNAGEADVAVTNAIALLWERELSVLFLRAIALLRVIASNDYTHGMRCSSRLKLNLDEFPHIEMLLEKAKHLTFDALQNEGRIMSDKEHEEISILAKDIEKISSDYKTIIAELTENVTKLQEKIDHYLIVQSRPRVYAVRLNDAREVEALLLLDH